MSFAEQRRTRRYEVEKSILVVRDGSEHQSTTRNMSLGGIGFTFEADPPMKVGERVTLKLRIPQLADPLVVEADVRWTAGEAVGVQFVTGLRAKETWALGQFLESHGKVD